MVEPEIQIVKAGRGPNPFLLFLKTSREPGLARKLPEDGWMRTGFGLLLCFGSFMILALAVETLRGRL